MSDFSSVPIINISALLSPSAGETEVEMVAQEIGSACRNVGFFYIKNHGVDPALETKLEALSREFFKLDLETKNEISMSKGGRTWRGYFPVGGELTSGKPDMKEGIYFGSELGDNHPVVQAGLPMHGANLFPSSVPELKETVLDYIDAMTNLGHVLLGAISLSLGLPRDFFRVHFMQDPLCLFRIFNYPAGKLVSQNGEELWGVGEHTDYGLLTILKQDMCGGLQVRNMRNEWIEAPPVPGTFTINIGDMLEKLTHGHFRSTPHRVKNLQPTIDRVSFPFFFDPTWSARMDPIPSAAAALARPDGTACTRWDGKKVEDFNGTYGEYILGKVLKVFPELGTQISDVSGTVSSS